MFMAQNVIQTRDYVTMRPSPYSSLAPANLRNAALNVHGMKYVDDDEKNSWDRFYATELGAAKVESWTTLRRS